MKTCANCQSPFEVADKDREFYQTMEVSEPTFCPPCREQRRMLQVNQMNLYKRKCDQTGDAIISNYHSESPFKVYSQKYWFSDQFDTTEYGREFDFNRPFFEQLMELWKAVPRPALFTDFLNDENSDFTNYAGKNKDCYLIMDSDENRDCYYSYSVNGSKNSSDCFRLDQGELCYENVDSKNCYNSSYIYNSDNCSDSMFLANCIGVKNSIMCSNLRQKEYHIFNKPVRKEEFEKVRDSLKSRDVLNQAFKKFNEFRKRFPQRSIIGFSNENVSGNYLVNCKNADHCFDSRGIWDGKYCTQIFMPSKNIMDCDEVGGVELGYESNNAGYDSYNLRFTLQSLDVNSNLTYANYCYHSSDLFGSIGLRNKKYCILNKQYTKEDYEKLVPQIIEHMKATGEWGEYYPAWMSSFAYNKTMAQDYFPLTKEQALEKGYQWQDEDQQEFLEATFSAPDTIDEVEDSVLQESLKCDSCAKNYRIVEQELKFYRQLNLPLPTTCFFCRHKARMKGRNPRHLYERQCDQCQTAINTTYSPKREEKVYCEDCYQKSLV